MRTLLARGSFRDLLVGQAVSSLGDWMVTVALMALVLQLSDSSAAVGGILALRLLPALVASSAVARASRRWDRRRTMLAMDLARAGIVVLIPLVEALWWVYVWAFVLELCGLVFLPARDASLPDLVHDDDLATANGLVLGASFGTIPLGGAAFAAVAALTPFGDGGSSPALLPVFIVDAATFLLSFSLLRGLPDLSDGERSTEAAPGLRAALRLPLVRSVLPAAVIVALGIGSLFSLGIVFVRDVLGASDTQFGVLVVMFGIGATGGLVALARYPGLPGLSAVTRGLALQGATIAVMSLAPGIVPTFLGAALFGGSTAFSLAAGMGQLQNRLDGDDRMVAFTAFHVVIRAALALAALAAGVAGDLVPTETRLPLIDKLEPARVVLLGAGLVVLFGSRLIPTEEDVPSRPGISPA